MESHGKQAMQRPSTGAARARVDSPRSFASFRRLAFGTRTPWAPFAALVALAGCAEAPPPVAATPCPCASAPADGGVALTAGSPRTGAAAPSASAARSTPAVPVPSTAATAVYSAQPLPPLPASPAAGAAADARFVYVGTYTAPGTAPGGHRPSVATGIGVFRMNPSDGGLTPVQTMPATNPSFLAVDPSATHLYATQEDGLVAGHPGGRVTAYAIDAKSGVLTALNSQPTDGTYPAHLSVDPSGKFLLGSNYGTGDFPIYRLLPDGRIGPKTDDVRDTGNGAGPRPDRQDGPHAHQIVAEVPSGCVFGVDLGSDRVSAWKLGANGKLAPAPVPYATVASGAGPRHLAFEPSHKFAYVIDELSATITAFHLDAPRCALVAMQTVSTLPTDFQGPRSGSEIRVHPSGRFLYATNRGHDSVVAFRIDPGAGTLTPIGWTPSQGEWPRGMNIDPSGTFLYVANQNSDDVVVFRIDPEGGTLAPTGAVVHTPTPADVEFGPKVAP